MVETPKLISVAAASAELNMDPRELKGFALGLGIVLRKAGQAHVMTRRDLERIRVESGRRKVVASP